MRRTESELTDARASMRDRIRMYQAQLAFDCEDHGLSVGEVAEMNSVAADRWCEEETISHTHPKTQAHFYAERMEGAFRDVRESLARAEGYGECLKRSYEQWKRDLVQQARNREVEALPPVAGEDIPVVVEQLRETATLYMPGGTPMMAEVGTDG